MTVEEVANEFENRGLVMEAERILCKCYEPSHHTWLGVEEPWLVRGGISPVFFQFFQSELCKVDVNIIQGFSLQGWFIEFFGLPNNAKFPPYQA